ncbi:efflux RND transporter periplasmic adaptor subunit [Paracoccus sp. (in: a-proteobacteria)]|uniref:efflux RND transporter periplasmic adaptor subunit n=1 Tax=Paracoccus sp. TaxID=267 RepID=UPI003A8A475B
MRFLFRSLSGLFITALTIGLLFLAGFQVWQATVLRGQDDGPSRRAGEQVYTARLITLQAQRADPVMEVYALIQSRRRLELRAGAAGQIVMLDPAMHEGGEVRAGQILARIDPAAAQAALDSQIAARDDAQATLADARRKVRVATDDLVSAERQAQLRHAAVDRQNELAARGLGTSADREAAELAASSADQVVLAGKSALASAEASVTAAENALHRAEILLTEARRELADTEIRARFDGKVTGVTAVEGGLVSMNEKLAEIIDPDALEVQIPLSLQQFTRLAAGGPSVAGTPMTVVLDGSSGQLTAKARLDRTSASVAEGAAARIVYARITESEVALRPGDFVTVRIQEPALTDVAQVPAAAVGADSAVLVADVEGRLTAARVEVLRHQGDDVIIRVPAELNGTRIVAERAPQLGTGIRVRDADAPAPAADQRAQNRRGRGNG